jgi:hypothetical protein
VNRIKEDQLVPIRKLTGEVEQKRKLTVAKQARQSNRLTAQREFGWLIGYFTTLHHLLRL